MKGKTLLKKVFEHAVEGTVLDEEERSSRELADYLFFRKLAKLFPYITYYLPRVRYSNEQTNVFGLNCTV